MSIEEGVTIYVDTTVLEGFPTMLSYYTSGTKRNCDAIFNWLFSNFHNQTNVDIVLNRNGLGIWNVGYKITLNRIYGNFMKLVYLWVTK